MGLCWLSWPEWLCLKEPRWKLKLALAVSIPTRLLRAGGDSRSAPSVLLLFLSSSPTLSSFSPPFFQKRFLRLRLTCAVSFRCLMCANKYPGCILGATLTGSSCWLTFIRVTLIPSSATPSHPHAAGPLCQGFYRCSKLLATKIRRLSAFHSSSCL